MKKVLILSYFYPPGNFAGSYRVKSWMDYFLDFGYFPILVTRHWNPNETDYTGIAREEEKKLVKTHEAEIHYLPFKGGLRDRFLRRTAGRLQVIGKLLSFFEIIFQNYFLRLCPYRNLYEEARKIIEKNQDIEMVITSGRPFYLFRFGHLLKREFPWIDWIADYRDPWTTNPINRQSLKMRFLSSLEEPLEKKWLSNASFFSTCSNLWVKQLKKLTGKPGFVLQNGYDNNFFSRNQSETKTDKFTIIYIGTLYDNQPIEMFVKGFLSFSKGKGNARLVFAGAGSDPKRLSKIKAISLESHEKIEVLPKIEQSEVFKLLQSSNICVLTNYKGERGRHTAKLFDYLASQKPIILCPSDEDVMEEMIMRTHSGYVVNSSQEALDLLERLYGEWLSNGSIKHNPALKEIEKYSRKAQAGVLCAQFDKILYERSKERRSFINQCPLCSSKKIKKLKGYAEAALVQCQHCHFVYSKNNPSEPELVHFYENYTYDENYYSSPLTRLRYSQLLDKMEPYRSNNRLLDVGCGNGDFLQMARERGWDCLGTEFSEAAVKICKQKGLNVLKGTLEELQEELPEFDVITSFEVIEHINTPAREVDLIQKHLRKGGLFYVTTPNFDSLMRKFLGRKYDAIMYPEHLSYFTPKTLKNLMEEKGFEQKEISVAGFSFSRFRNSLFGTKENPFTPDSLDERFRMFMESKPFLRKLKNGTDQLFTITNLGLGIKGWFQKRS